MLLLISPRNVTTQIWSVPLIGWKTLPTWYNQSEAQPRSGSDKGCFPFSQNFWNFRFGGKWNTFRWFVPLENSQKKWKILKGGPVFPVGISERNVSRSLYQFQVHGRAPLHAGVYEQNINGTFFYQSEIPLLLQPKFPGFFPIMEFLHSLLRHYFVGKPVVLVQNVSCLFRLGFLGTLTAGEIHHLIIKGMMTIDILVNSLCFLLMNYVKVKSVLHKLALTKLGNKKFICLSISNGWS